MEYGPQQLYLQDGGRSMSYNSNEDQFVAYINYVNGKQDLLELLKDKLKFPDYFGFNWDALNDCLADFTWLIQKKIIIVHNERPCLSDKDMGIYVGILVGEIHDWRKWKNGKIHQLEVVFPESCKDEVEMYIAQAKVEYGLCQS